ncbi:hypothetical protein E3N88_36230 [Mikania micrantha]|uniref:Uncharacterized protein n=1 Tax=Mikania micrantha TaxID=192012 RepID=A0A5N6M342_9ASTR|nr:hypothetical protein E3N88_36230 [Mikania micrantha]
MLEMSESKDVVRIDVHGNNPVNNNNVVVQEWQSCLTGKEATKRNNRQRHIERVPPLLLKGETCVRNQSYYEPAVVSLGPYHHNQPEFAQAEKYKLITLEEFGLSCNKTMGFLYNKVFQVVEDARKCYIDGSTDDYNDEEFARMMLLDGCFVLFYIDCISSGSNKTSLNNEYLGALGFANVTRDIFLLENQIPFVVLEVLLALNFPEDKGETILNKFFNYLNYGEVMVREEKVLKNKQPLHLLELYRSYFISLAASLSLGSTRSQVWRKESKSVEDVEDYNYVKRNRSFASVMELKANWIFLKRKHEFSKEDINFLSHWCYVVQGDDVKELRKNNILLHSLGSDDEVVKMFDEIQAPLVNLYMFNQLRREIEMHCNHKYKTWTAELIATYFSSPWKAMALFVASAILFTSFLQTYFTIKPLPDDSNGDVMKLLRQCEGYYFEVLSDTRRELLVPREQTLKPNEVPLLHFTARYVAFPLQEDTQGKDLAGSSSPQPSPSSFSQGPASSKPADTPPGSTGSLSPVISISKSTPSTPWLLVGYLPILFRVHLAHLWFQVNS